MGFYSSSEAHEKAWKEKVAKKNSFAINLVRDIKESIEKLENLPGDWENNDEIKSSLLEIQVKLTDCIIDVQDNWEMTEGYYRYNEEEMKPEYVIWMTKRMEDQFMEIIKDDPAFRLELEDIEKDENYPDTRRNHIARCLSTLVFNYILDNLKSQKEAKQLRQCNCNSTEKASLTSIIPDSEICFNNDIKMYPSNGINIDTSANTFTIKNNQQA